MDWRKVGLATSWEEEDWGGTNPFPSHSEPWEIPTEVSGKMAEGSVLLQASMGHDTVPICH